MRNTTDRKKRLVGAAVAAGLVILLALVLIGSILLCFFPGQEVAEAVALGVIGLYLILLLAVVGGVAVSLVQRFREIRGGEEDEARKY